jgi:ABC-type multidrug transport system fused ATPase/permease subunit
LYLIDIVKQFKRGIILALSLVIIENVAWIIEPTLFGNVIDALIDTAADATRGGYLVPLLLWIGAFAVNSGVGAYRRSLDQRIYLNMFTEIATNVSRISQEQQLSVSKTAARAQLSQQFITFFQYRVPEILEQLISIGGAMIGMAFFDYRIAVACAVVVAPLMLINKMYTKRVAALQTSLHDSYEETFEIFSSQDPARVYEYYKKLARPQQRIANMGALSFGLIRFVLLGIFLVVLHIAIDLDNFSTGNIFAIVAYLWTFVTSSEYLPELMESWTSLKDISGRIRGEQM